MDAETQQHLKNIGALLTWVRSGGTPAPENSAYKSVQVLYEAVLPFIQEHAIDRLGGLCCDGLIVRTKCVRCSKILHARELLKLLNPEWQEPVNG